MTQEDIILNALLHGRTISSVQAFVEWGIMSTAPVVSRLNKRLKKSGSNIVIQKYINREENSSGVVIPYAYYYINELDIEEIEWPEKTTSFVRMQGESKKDAIKRFIKTYGSINTIQGFTEIYAYRIGAAISELRKEGYVILTTRIHVPGRVHPIAEYRIISEPNE